MADNVVEQGFAVTDKVAGTIAPKLDQIALASGRAALAETRLAAATARTQSAQYAALTSMQRMVTETARAKAANTNAAISAERLAQAELRTAQAQDRAAQSASRLAAARQRANAANKASRSSGFLGEAGQAAASGGGVGSAVSGAIGRAAMSNPYVAAGAIGVGALAGAVATHANYADQYAGLQNSLKNVTGSVETTGIALIELNKIANDTRAPIDAVAEGYARFSRALAPLGKSQQEVMEFQRTLNTMLFQYGKTGSEAASATLQLTQAMGKGKLDGDEFRSVMENLPELGTAIAAELGVTRGELLKLAPQGKITGDVIYNAMARAKAQIGELPPPVMTLDMAMTKLSNATTVWFGELEQSQGIVASAVKWIGSLGDAATEASQKMLEARLVQKGLVTEGSVASFLKVTPEELKNNKDLADAVRGVASAYRDATVSANAGVSSAEGDAQRALKLMEKAQGLADAARSKEQERVATTMKREKREAEILGIVTETLDKSEQDLRFAKMTAEDRAVAVELLELENKLKKEGTGLSEVGEASLKRFEENTRAAFRLQQKSGGETEKRAITLAKINGQLDNEIERIGMLADERAKQQRFDAIQESLITKKITLDNQEIAAIREKIALAEQGKKLQAEIDAVYAEATGATEQYNLALEANNALFVSGAIDQERYMRNRRAAQIEQQKALDVLYEQKKAIENERKLLQVNAREREIANSLLAIENILHEKGYRNAHALAEGYRAQYEQLRDLREQRAAEDAMVGSIIEKQRELNLQTYTYWKLRQQLADLGQDATTRMQIANDNGLDLTGTRTAFQAQIEAREQTFARIQELRQLDIINEREASAAKVRIWQQEQQSKLDLATTFFSNFVGLQRSENKEVAAIGKAAAIANATIKTYEAANAAYAAMAGIPVVGPVLGAAAAAGAIASGIVNVQNIASTPTGFAQGGYTGNMPANDVAGVVHGREYVIDAANTARIGRRNLDALNSGGSIQGSSGGGPTMLNASFILVASLDEANAMAAGKGDNVVIAAVGRNARTINRMLKASG